MVFIEITGQLICDKTNHMARRIYLNISMVGELRKVKEMFRKSTKHEITEGAVL